MKPVCLLLLFCGIAAAELDRIEIRSREDAGSFERITGRAYYSVDPKLAPNQAIADISFAPKNVEGKVEFSGDFLFLRPKKSRGSVFLEIPNRGGPQSLQLLSGGGGGASPERWDLGDRFLLEQGFTVAFVGWQFDVAASRGLGLRVPVAPVKGVVRESYVNNGSGRSAAFALTYCAADADDTSARLTFRQKIDETAKPIDRRRWHFVNNGCGVALDGGFDVGLYDAVYQAQNPPIAGLGMAAIRDFASYLKNGGKTDVLRDQPSALTRVIGYGYSQSARFLRTFVHDGFNQDEHGLAAFDGLFVASAGAGGGSFNHRFAIPGEAGNSVLNILRPTDIPPFTDDGLLAKAESAHVTPRIFYTFSSTEYWARAGSLTYTTADGKADIPLGPRSRLYFLTGTPHSMGGLPLGRRTRSGDEVHYINFAEQRWVGRALVLDLDEWIAVGKEPPPSHYPTVQRGELVARESVAFPKSTAISVPAYMPQVFKMDFGPEFVAKGIIANEPPLLGSAFIVKVPQVDDNGNELGGVRLPEVAAPLGTFAGWNVLLPQMTDLHYLSGLIGSFEPFPKTREDRQKAGDARKSVAERYTSRQDYLDHVDKAVQELMRERLLLKNDTPGVLQRAGEMWDTIVR
jgi:hypothetical protein